jgi:outer membrane immunogenic protein
VVALGLLDRLLGPYDSSVTERPRTRSMLVLVNRAWTFLVIAGVAVCLTQVAAATELNNFPVTPPQPQKPDWAGFYFRTNPGSGSDSLPWTTLGTSSGFASPAPATSPINESFGYNFQSGNFVFGLEGALAAANFDGRFTSPNFAPAGAWTPNMNWMGSVAGRLGYSVGQWLPYVKGGFAAAEVGSPLQNSPIGAFSQGSELGGWTAGVGVEYQFAPKWSLGLEYLYTDLGNGSGAPNSLGGAPISGAPEMYSTALKTQSLLGRLNYKPGW